MFRHYFRLFFLASAGFAMVVDWFSMAGRELVRCIMRRVGLQGLLDFVCVSCIFISYFITSIDPHVPQYNDNVVGPGSPKYDNAYFEISYVRAYTTPNPPATSTSTSASDPTPTSATPVVITAPPTAKSSTVSGSVNGAASTFLDREKFVWNWGYLLCGSWVLGEVGYRYILL